MLAAEKLSQTKTVFQKIQDELKLQRLEAGADGEGMLYKFSSKYLESGMGENNPQETKVSS